MRFCILLILIAPLFAVSQTNVSEPKCLLVGEVKDLENADPIVNATIRIIGMDSSTQEIGVDSNGYFETKLKVQVAYSITVSAPGYLNAKGREYSPESKKLIHLYELAPIEGCSGMIPLMIYNEGDFKNPLAVDEPDTDVLKMMCQIITDNSILIVEFTAYRDSNEQKSISKKRADYAVKRLIALGIDEKRLVAVDGKTDNEITNKLRESDLNKEAQIEHNRFLTFSIKGTLE